MTDNELIEKYKEAKKLNKFTHKKFVSLYVPPCYSYYTTIIPSCLSKNKRIPIPLRNAMKRFVNGKPSL